MKITKVDILHIGAVGHRSLVMCRVYTDKGIYGDGEVAGIHACEATVGVLKGYARKILGMDPMRTEEIWETLYKEFFWGQNGGGITFSGIGALDIALWDIKGKYFGVPVYQLLGGKTRDKVRCYASQLQFGWPKLYTTDKLIPQRTPEDYARVARQAVEDGYTAIKADLFTFCPETEGPSEFTRAQRNNAIQPKYIHMIEARARAMREAVGEDVEIIIENHSRTDAFGGIQIARALEPLDILYLEEPSTPTPYVTRRIAEETRIPLASGERIYTRWQYIPYFENRSLSIIQPDIQNCGGFTETKKICDMAHAYDVGVQIHTCGGPLSTNIALQLEAVIPNFVIHEHHVNTRLTNCMKVCDHVLQPVDGYLQIPTEPGLGNEISPAAYQQAKEVVTVS